MAQPRYMIKPDSPSIEKKSQDLPDTQFFLKATTSLCKIKFLDMALMSSTKQAHRKKKLATESYVHLLIFSAVL